MLRGMLRGTDEGDLRWFDGWSTKWGKVDER